MKAWSGYSKKEKRKERESFFDFLRLLKGLAWFLSVGVEHPFVLLLLHPMASGLTVPVAALSMEFLMFSMLSEVFGSESLPHCMEILLSSGLWRCLVGSSGGFGLVATALGLLVVSPMVGSSSAVSSLSSWHGWFSSISSGLVSLLIEVLDSFKGLLTVFR